VAQPVQLARQALPVQLARQALPVQLARQALPVQVGLELEVSASDSQTASPGLL
jgi:hypothetical protein